MRQLTASYLIATFFNNFLPSNIGGDIVRVRDGSRLTGSTTASLAVVGIDRILGFGALYLLAAVAFVMAPAPVRGLAGARAVLLGLALLFCGARVRLLPARHRRATDGASRGSSSISWARERFETVQGAVHAYRERIGLIWLAGLASLAVQALAVLYYLAIARALRHPAAGRRRVPDGAAVHAAAGAAGVLQRLGVARGPVRPLLLAARACRGRAPSRSPSSAPG